MELHATEISTRASQILDRNEDFQVKAAFGRVINLEAAGREVLAVQVDGTAFTPLSIMVSGGEFRKLREARAGRGVKLRVLHGKPCDCRMPVIGGVCPREWRDRLLQLIFTLARGGSLAPAANDVLWSGLENPDPVQCTAREILGLAEEQLALGNCIKAAAFLSSLSGLGPGLTPAGDDFLLGVLAVCSHWPKGVPPNFTEELIRAMEARAGQRTWLSAALLNCARSGEFSSAIRDILMAEDSRSLARAVAMGAAWGHTSGSDTLGGILWMAEQAGRQQSLKEETPNL